MFRPPPLSLQSGFMARIVRIQKQRDDFDKESQARVQVAAAQREETIAAPAKNAPKAVPAADPLPRKRRTSRSDLVKMNNGAVSEPACPLPHTTLPGRGPPCELTCRNIPRDWHSRSAWQLQRCPVRSRASANRRTGGPLETITHQPGALRFQKKEVARGPRTTVAISRTCLGRSPQWTLLFR